MPLCVADAVTLRVISTLSGAVLSTESMLKAAQPGSGAAQQVQAAYLGSYRRKDKPDGFRYMLWRSIVQCLNAVHQVSAGYAALNTAVQ